MPGVLLAERYCWKSFVSNPPILYMKTLATKSTILELPSGYVEALRPNSVHNYKFVINVNT